MAAKFEEIQGSKSTTTDAGYGKDFGAYKTMKASYKHPKGLNFAYTHKDCKDYEDVSRKELIEIGSKKIQYSYDWGNYFILELLHVYSDKNEVATGTREYGVVDPEKKSVENKEAGEKFLDELAKDFEMTVQQFVNACCETFGISKEIFGVFTQ